jgi:hypothetical protein
VELLVGGERLTVPVASAGTVPGGRVRLLVRPEWGRLDGPLPGRVTAVRYRGADTDYRLETQVGAVEVRERGAPRAAVGAAVGWAIDRGWLLARPSVETSVEERAPIPASAPDPSAPVAR